MKWEIVKLGDHLDFSTGPAFKSKDFTTNPDDMPLVKGENIGFGNILWKKSKYYPIDEANYYQKFFLKPSDIVLAMDRPWVKGGLKFGWIKENDPQGLLVQRVALLRGINGLNQNFLRYIVLSPDFTNYLKSMQGGVGVPHISGGDIKNYQFELPPLPYQKKIASILSAYDNLIENNLRQIELLEEAAQRIYQEWFVQLRFPGFEEVEMVDGLPIGWEKVRLGELIDYFIGGGWGKEEYSSPFVEDAFVIRGTDMNKIMKGNLSNVPYRFHKPSNLKSRKLIENDIVFEVSGGSGNSGVGRVLFITPELLTQFNSDVMCASFCKLVRPKEGYGSYLFQVLNFMKKVRLIEVFEIYSASNIVNFNFTAFLKHQKIIKPDEKTMTKFNSLSSEIYKKISIISSQNQTLQEARDILLPRLMNGTITAS